MTIISMARARIAAPPSHRLHHLPTVALAADLLVVAASALIAVWGRKHLSLFSSATDVSSSLTVAGPMLVIGWVVMIGAFGGYRADVFGAGADEFKRVFNASLVSAGLLGVACYLAKFPLSRGFFLLLFVVGIPALLIGRKVLRMGVHQARKQGRLQLRVLIAGSPAHIDEIAGVLQRERWMGYRVIGAALRDGEHQLEETPSGVPVVAHTGEIVDAVSEIGADVVFFAGGGLTSGRQLRQIVWDLEKEDVQVVVAPSVTDISSERVKVRPVGGLPLMHIDPPRATDAVRLGKRAFDLVGALALIAVFSPLLAYAALRIKLNDRGPVLFRHTRIGKDGQEFSCLKFRTMVVNAESLLLELQQDTGQSALLFKMKDDPRITKPGRWLRRFSVDELPQLFNVVRGEMSLVGPRPQVAREVELYQGGMARRLRVRPGMTGLWQVSGRNDLTVDEAMRLDLFYVDNWSMLQDLSILLRTFGAVFSSRGAY